MCGNASRVEHCPVFGWPGAKNAVAAQGVRDREVSQQVDGGREVDEVDHKSWSPKHLCV